MPVEIFHLDEGGATKMDDLPIAPELGAAASEGSVGSVVIAPGS